MNDPKLATRMLQEIITASHPDSLDLPARSALFAACREIARDLSKHVKDDHGNDGYALEKISQVRWHVAAALGFDITNGHPSDQHRVWALGALSSFESHVGL